jgi:hypothetical protein
LIKPRDAVEVVKKIVEKPRCARYLIESDSVFWHAFLFWL